ncbi:hypothetical protein AAHH79_40235, partial [Burkholderia pseudomallei]
MNVVGNSLSSDKLDFSGAGAAAIAGLAVVVTLGVSGGIGRVAVAVGGIDDGRGHLEPSKPRDAAR